MLKNKTFIIFFLFITVSCKKEPVLPVDIPVEVQKSDLEDVAIPVEVQKLHSEDFRSISEFVGILEAKQKSTLASIVEGRIIEIAVQEGDTVEQEDTIVQIQSSQDYKELEKNPDLIAIKSPIDGIIGTIQPNPGDFVAVGEQITTVTNNEILELNIAVPLDEASKLKLGLPIKIIDNRVNATATAEISFISPSADLRGDAILVKAAFNNNGMFIDGSSVLAKVIWSKSKGIAIPTDAISRIAGQNFVFVATEKEQEDGKKTLVAEQRPVKLGLIQGRYYQVLSGLMPGEKLITSGIKNLTDGIPVKLKNSIEN